MKEQKPPSPEKRVAKWGKTEWDDTWSEWSDIPSVFQASLLWAFLCNGPDSTEDLIRLTEAFLYGGISHSELFAHEEPRWMCNALIRAWPRLLKRKIFEGVGIFLEIDPKTVQDHFLKRIKNRRRDNNRWLWVDRRVEELLHSQTPFADLKLYESKLLNYRLRGPDFLFWLYARVMSWDRIQARKSQAGQLHEQSKLWPNGLEIKGCFFPVDMGEWTIQKCLLPDPPLLGLGYLPYHQRFGAPFSNTSVDVWDLEAHFKPGLGPARLTAVKGSLLVGGASASVNVYGTLCSAWKTILHARAKDPEHQLSQALALPLIQRMVAR